MTSYVWQDGSDFGTNPQEVEASCEQFILQLIQGGEAPIYSAYIKTKDGRSRAASAVQKSIRRGYTDQACLFANAILRYEPDYIWRRICTIAIEDIGIGNIHLVASLLWVSGKKQWRAKNGGDALVLDALVRALCASAKDRHACDLLVWADLDPTLQHVRDDYTALAEKQQFDTLFDRYEEDDTLAHRMIAAWAICGTKAFPGARFPEGVPGLGIKGLVDYHLNNNYVPPPVVPLISRWAASRQYEGMPMAFYLVWELAKKSQLEGSLPFVNDADALHELPHIGSYPSAAFDMHNSSGSKALNLFRQLCPPIQDFIGLCDPHFTVPWRDIVGTLVFRLEGHQVQSRLQYQGMSDLLELAEFAHLQGNYIPGELADWGMQILASNMDLLHYARVTIANGVLPNGTPTQEPPEAVYVDKP